MTWFRKFSFDYDDDDDDYEGIFEDVPIPTAVPAKYDDIGHGEDNEAIPWFFIDGKLVFGTTSHMDILNPIRKERGDEIAFSILMNNWRGRYDPIQHEMSMTIEKAERAGQEVQPPPALVNLLRSMFPDVERIWSFPGSRPVLGHFDNDALDRMYKFAWKHSFAANYFDQENQKPWEEFDDQLRELFKTEYVIGELKRRAYLEPVIPFSPRFTHWLQKLEEHALGLATQEVGPKMQKFLNNWLAGHSSSGFAENIVGIDINDPQIPEDGVIRGGGDFTYEIGDEVIEAFLKSHPVFVRLYFNDTFADEEYLAEYIEYHGHDPLEFNDEETFDYVKEEIEDIGYTFQGLRDWLSEHGDFDEALLSVLKTHVYPAWRTYWGDSIEVAEKNVQGASERLAQALESDDLGSIFAAINIALNAQHIHGGMYMNMDLDKRLMDELSNLDTNELDQFVDMVIGQQTIEQQIEQPPQIVDQQIEQQNPQAVVAKVAQYTPIKVPKFHSEEFEVIISDVDRYTADKYWITVQILESIHKYSIGLNIINSHVGVCGQGQYWHYKKSESSQAKKTFRKIKNIVQQLHDEIEYVRPPMAIIAPMFRSSMHYVDYTHRERSGVYHYNWFEELPKVADWRCSLYGQRYPDPPTATQPMSDFLINIDEQSKDVVSKGSARGRHVYYKQASIKQANDDPLALATFIGTNWRWTVPAAVAFLTWFASVGGDSNQLIQDIHNGATPTEVLRQVQPENMDDQAFGNEPERVIEPEIPEISQEIPENNDNAVDLSPETPYSTVLDTSNFDGLDPMFAQKVKQILSRLSQKGWQPRVAEGLRSIEEQQEKINGGFSSLKNPQDSKHVQGLAVDIIDARYGWGGDAADFDFSFWNDLGEAAREVGLTWGGNWKTFRDVAHVETGNQKDGMTDQTWTYKYAAVLI